MLPLGILTKAQHFHYLIGRLPVGSPFLHVWSLFVGSQQSVNAVPRLASEWSTTKQSS